MSWISSLSASIRRTPTRGRPREPPVESRYLSDAVMSKLISRICCSALHLRCCSRSQVTAHSPSMLPKIEFAVRQNLPFVAIVADDQGWASRASAEWSVRCSDCQCARTPCLRSTGPVPGGSRANYGWRSTSRQLFPLSPGLLVIIHPLTCRPCLKLSRELHEISDHGLENQLALLRGRERGVSVDA
jgi:hypothetical protein